MKKKEPNFYYLLGEYKLNSYYGIKDSGKYSEFEATYSISLIRDGKSFHCELDRSNVLINQRRPNKLMDQIMLDIGNSIYPIKMIIDSEMQIRDILNFDEIKSNWNICTQKYLEKYPSAEMDRYVRMATVNLTSKQNFIHALYQDTFFNLYFRDIISPIEEGEAKAIQWVNFPVKSRNSTYLYSFNSSENIIHASGEIMKITPSQEGNYEMNYELGEYNHIDSIRGSVEGSYHHKHYEKKIEITFRLHKIENTLHSIILE